MKMPKFSGFGNGFDKPSACDLYFRKCARSHTQPKYEDWFEASLQDAVESVLQDDPVWIAYLQEEEDRPDIPPEIEDHLHEVEEDMRKILKQNEASVRRQFAQDIREWQYAECDQDDDDARELLDGRNGDLGFGLDSDDPDDVDDYNDFLENRDKD
jgi:uncharacterized UBP type Zn finger protein